MVDIGLAKNNQNTADNLIGTTESKPILKRGDETVKTILGPTIISEETPTGTDGFIVGNPSYDIVGTSTVGGPSLTIVRSKIINFDNIHYEYFTTTVLKDSDDTATWGTGELDFDGVTDEEAISTVVFKNTGETVFSAKATMFAESGAEITGGAIFVKTSSGGIWEQINSSSFTTLTSGTELYYKVTNVGTPGLGFPTAFGTWGAVAILQQFTIHKLILEYEV